MNFMQRIPSIVFISQHCIATTMGMIYTLLNCTIYAHLDFIQMYVTVFISTYPTGNVMPLARPEKEYNAVIECKVSRFNHLFFSNHLSVVNHRTFSSSQPSTGHSLCTGILQSKRMFTFVIHDLILC